MTSKKQNSGGLSTIEDEDVWIVVKEYFSNTSLVASQIDSYNVAINGGFNDIISPLKVIDVKDPSLEGQGYKIRFGNLLFQRPKIVLDGKSTDLFPMDAILKNVSYTTEVLCDIIITNPSGETVTHPKKSLGYVPVMVGSDICATSRVADNILRKHHEDILDVGGYFILTPKMENVPIPLAQRKILIPQERTALNKTYVHYNRNTVPKYAIYAEIRSNDFGFHTTTTLIGRRENSNVYTTILPWFDTIEVVASIVFKALGILEKEDIMAFILFEKYDPSNEVHRRMAAAFEKTLEYSYECSTQTSALRYINKNRKRKAKSTITPDEDRILSEEEIEAITAAAAISGEDISYAVHLLSAELFPHIRSGTNSLPPQDPESSVEDRIETLRPVFRKNAEYLGYMINALLKVELGLQKPESRDHHANKRLATTGKLLTDQFYGAFRKLTNEIVVASEKSFKNGNIVNILTSIKQSIITNAMHSAIASNLWLSGGQSSKGISQTHEQFNYVAGIASERKASVPLSVEGNKIIEPRDLQATQWGVKCPAETPEGKRCGLITAFALACIITLGTNHVPILAIVAAIMGTAKKTKNGVKSIVFVNGIIVGFSFHPEDLVGALIRLRRSGRLSPDTSISYNAVVREVSILTDGGRVCRPLFVVNDGKLAVTRQDIADIVAGNIRWKTLVSTGKIEIIDKLEEENYYIALYPSNLEIDPERSLRYTHCEIHPSLMFGIGASIIPFPDHNQSPRNTYQSAMGKQAVGIPFLNYRSMPTTFHTIDSMHTPLALTTASSIIGFDKVPAGQNGMVLVAALPFNQEDSIVLNASSVQRDFMVTTKWVTFYTEIRPEKRENFGIPKGANLTTDFDRLKASVENIDERGFARPGTVLKKGDIIIFKYVENPPDSRKKYTFIGVLYEHTWSARVDRVALDLTGEGYNYIRVSTYQRREPVVGDKFAARHGQKGTAGKLIRQEDLPFTATGTYPDIVVNPLAIPSRMTIAMLIEAWTGKVITSPPLETAKVSDFFEEKESDPESPGPFQRMFNHPTRKGVINSTPFRKFDINVIKDELKKSGVNVYCDTVMYDGETGQKLQNLMFYAPIFYQRLKHMVIDKVHARARGGRTTLTRQPKEGRAAGGGIRTGVMERDVLLSQGAAYSAKDRLVDQSDEFKTVVCKSCGIIGMVSEVTAEGGKFCKLCETNNIANIKIPYGTKLAEQELMGCGIVPYILTAPT